MKLLEAFDAQMEQKLEQGLKVKSTPAEIFQPLEVPIFIFMAVRFFPELTGGKFWFTINIEDGNIYEL